MPGFKSDGLTKRQREIVALRLQGYSYKDVAGILGISYHTVKSRLQDVYWKLDVHTVEELYNAMLNEKAS